MRVIDVHTHVVPERIKAESRRHRLWPSVESKSGDTAAVIIDGKVFRLIDSRCWDVRRRLADMDLERVDIQVLSPMPELLSHWIDASDANYLAAKINEFIAGMIACAPDRFRGLGMVPAQDPVAAVRSVDSIADLGLSGIEIGTHVNGTPLGDRSLWPIYEAAESRDLGIFIHPLRPFGLERIGGTPEVGLAGTFPLEIAMAALSLFAGGVLKAFPKLRFLLSHGGGALTSVLGRLDAIRGVTPALQEALHEDAKTLARRLWYDSNVYDTETLRFVVNKVGEEKLVVGSDYPFLIRQKCPAAFVADALPDMAHQCFRNAMAWLRSRPAQIIGTA